MNKRWTCNSFYSFADEDFAKIYSFFVIECPVENISIRGITFKEKKVNKTALSNKIKGISKELKEHWFPITESNEDDIIELVKTNGIFSHGDSFKEIAVFNVQKKLKETNSFFYSIRCAFAHGGFCIHRVGNHKYYCFENIDINSNTEIIKAIIILKETTLLEIIDYCKSKFY